MPVDQLSAPGPIALLPIAVTLALALWLRNVIVGLFAGVCVGVGHLSLAKSGVAALPVLLPEVIRAHLVPQITDGYNAGVLVLLVFIGGFVALVEHSGGAGAFARAFAHRLTDRASVQLATWGAGIAIFFSDLGTPLIVGPVFRPLADRLRVSRQKLALILDATASPVAILIPFIGWGVYVMGLLRQTFDDMGSAASDYAAFVAAVPFQFYAWLAIAAVPLVALGRCDWGPRWQVLKGRLVERSRSASPKRGRRTIPRRWIILQRAPSLVWLPLLAMALTLLALLGPSGFPLRPVPGAEFRAGLASAYLVANAASIRCRIAVGHGAGGRTLTLKNQALARTDSTPKPFTANQNGFSLSCAVSCQARQRDRLERLCRYITRPALCLERLSTNVAGQAVYQLKKPFRDGTTHILFSPQDLIARLAALVPRPRANLTRYHGVFAPSSPMRSAIVPTQASAGQRRKHKDTTAAPATRQNRSAQPPTDNIDMPIAPLTWAQRRVTDH